MRRVLLLGAVYAALLSVSLADILWQNCVGLADNPRGKDGFYYNLCIQKHKFVRERHPWQFIRTNLFNVEFDACTFVNTDRYSVNFTKAVFTHVKFKNSIFGSYVVQPTPMLIEKTALRHVTFDRCRFDKSAVLMFSEFEMTNVTFTECLFESDSVFQLGNMREVTFEKCSFQRSPSARVRSGGKTLKFSQITMRDVSFTDSNLLHPIVMQSVNGADLHFNDTSFSEFWCHSRETKPKLTSAFNDTVFQRCTFNSRVHCDETTWRGMSMLNASFRADADFSKSTINDIYWDEVTMTGNFAGDCTTLDFSHSVLWRNTLANMTLQCEMDLREASVEIVRFKNVRSRRYILKKATFKQERIDGECCTKVCPDWECRCNYTRSPTDVCPKAPYPVDLNAPQPCFPARASVHAEGGAKIQMTDLRHGARVAVGSGAHSDIYFFGHRAPERTAVFVEVAHAGADSPLRISPQHYLYVNGHLATAETVRVGDHLRDADGEQLVVTGVSRVLDTGLYAPTSLHGDLIVDGVHVSSYTAAIHPKLAHWMLAPLRVAYRAGLRGAVEQFTLFHDRSLDHVARFLGVPEGPQRVKK